ncbi:MAG: DUF4411 family protein [Microbacteriaceae bacterium]|nr:MAG: DUF4411 family protein [Microbacteriaceae bacterium]
MSDYTIDTSILIGLTRRNPRDVFPSVWAPLEELIAGGRACICSEALDETSRGDDDLHDWALSQSGFLCPPGRVELELATQISERYPGWARLERNAADPFVISHSAVHARVIVTDERRAGPNTHPHNMKIPNVASDYGIETIGFVELARREGWRI